MTDLERVVPLGGPAGDRFVATDFAPAVTLDLGAEQPAGWYRVAVALQAEHELQVGVLLPGAVRRSVLRAGEGGRFAGVIRARAPFRRVVIEPGRLPGAFRLAGFALERLGPGALLAELCRTVANAVRGSDRGEAERRYRAWIARHERAAAPSRPDAPPAPLALIVPAADAPAAAATIESLAGQSRAAAELVVAGPAAVLAELGAVLDALAASGIAAAVIRVPLAATATGAALAAAAVAASTAPRFVVLPAGVIARPRLVAALAEAAAAVPAAVLIHGDEDRIGPDGGRSAPRFKPAWSPALLLSANYLGVPVLVDRAAAVPSAAAPAEAEDHDLALRAIEAAPGRPVVRGVEVLASRTAAAPEGGWVRVAPSVRAQGTAAAVAGHLARTGRVGTVEPVAGLPGHVRIRRPLPDPAPLVSIIVPTRDRLDLIGACLDGLTTRTAYANREILVVDNGSTDPATLRYLAGIDGRNGVRVLRRPGPFNFSALNNAAAAAARGSVLCLVNDDVVPATPDWLADMVALALEPDVGPVGAKLVYPKGGIQHAGILLGMHGTCGHMDVGLAADAPGPDGRLPTVREVSAVTGACLVVRKAVYDALGGLDAEAFPVAFNDVDFCLRARDAGLRCLLDGFAVLTHAESASRGRDDDPARRARFNAEAARFRARWRAAVLDDPIVSPNLDRAEGASLARR